MFKKKEEKDSSSEQSTPATFRDKLSKFSKRVAQIVIVLIVLVLLYLSPQIFMLVKKLHYYKVDSSSTVYDNNNRVITYLYKNKHRLYVKYDEIPGRVVESFVAIEDTNFFEHHGINVIAIIRAAFMNLISGKIVQGASTITQQLIKNSVLTNKKTFTRKGKEIIISLIVDQLISKTKIMELYLNEIYFGSGFYGIKSAARGYFDKDLSELTIKEAAMLAGLPRSPNHYSPVRNYEFSLKRGNVVVERLYSLGWIDKEEYREALTEEPKVYNNRVRRYKNAPYAVDYILKKYLKKYPKLYGGGYHIYTTLDLDVQKIETEALKHSYEDTLVKIKDRRSYLFKSFAKRLNLESYFVDGKLDTTNINKFISATLQKYEKQKEKERKDKTAVLANKISDREERFLVKLKKLVNNSENNITSIDDLKDIYIQNEVDNFNGAMITLEPSSGAILALNGGVDYVKAPFNRAIVSHRQVGSSIKPFIYLTALDKGYSTVSEITDTARTFKYKGKNNESVTWSPKNSTNNFKGVITLKSALTHSINLATIGLVHSVGLTTVAKNLRRYGFSNVPNELSISLGSFESTVMQMSTIYTIISNNGVKKVPYIVEKITDDKGKILYQHKDTSKKRYEKARQIFLIKNIMHNVMVKGTGRGANVIGISLAGKTGTTNNGKDTWMVAMSPTVQSIVWFGNDDNTPIYSRGNAYGATIAGPVIRYFFSKLIVKKPNLKREFTMPKGVRKTIINGKTAYFTDISKPNMSKKELEDDTIFY